MKSDLHLNCFSTSEVFALYSKKALKITYKNSETKQKYVTCLKNPQHFKTF